MKRLRPSLLVLLAAIAAIHSSRAFAAEVCRFAGTTDHAGQVTVATSVAASNGLTTVDVTVTFESITMFWFHIHYLVQEISQWRGQELQSVAVNTRYLVGDRIVRQQWDRFQRDTDGLRGYRVQAKTLNDFRLKHPGFVRHWDPATFGQPWLPDYPSALPERRADLDLKAAPFPSGLRSPLALAFYWIRWLPRDGADISVFLPGFKADRLVDLPITGIATASGMTWRTPVRYKALSAQPVSTATASTSADGYLRQLAFDLHAPNGTARGTINQEGCEGSAVMPAYP